MCFSGCQLQYVIPCRFIVYEIEKVTLEAQQFFLKIWLKIEALSKDNVRSENAVLRKKIKLMACPFQFNTLYKATANLNG